MTEPLRIGLIVPSSNVTMETEIPALLRRHMVTAKYTFHSSRMAMRQVTKEELARMDVESERCARELSDVPCDVLVYACLVAIMALGPGHHVTAERRLTQAAAATGSAIPVVTSAGALIRGIHALGARRVAIIAPYLRPLTGLVVRYIEEQGIEVVDAISLEIADNRRVGRLDVRDLVGLAEWLDLRRAEAVVLSACVQMPSLAAIQAVEDRLGLPVLSAATATAFALLEQLDLPTFVPQAGRLLAGSDHWPLARGLPGNTLSITDPAIGRLGL